MDGSGSTNPVRKVPTSSPTAQATSEDDSYKPQLRPIQGIELLSENCIPDRNSPL